MKKSLLLAAVLFFCSFVFAQNELLVQHSDKGLYLDHTVTSGEGFYAIGRLFNIAPKDIAAFNGLDMNAGLNIGQVIKIPLNANNFTQTKNTGRAVYYVVEQKEGLYRVSLKNNKVLMANLRKWNHLGSDNISTGQKLVIGFLVSPEADRIVQVAPEVEKPKQQVEEPRKETAVVTPPVQKKEEPPVKEEKKADPVSRPVTPSPGPAVSDGSGGYFKSQYEQQIRTQPAKSDETASAGIFKTASGWQDAKYYALMDGVEPGTIIRVVNPTNNKAIYAKVLGEMSSIRQNQGYDVRISNAAAAVLEVSDSDKFIVRVNH